ncbi:WxL domain-containing protein [Lacticaseibacillus porcinae]|uniref:WxL domain-containing protein n=1 Tax=Lacticaseibacillus porcinae TaxID=1123687 RepID=UPI000F7709ED|nr:WxL domain-containing protein [Lacticaseibacillus porcinae]
MKKFTLVSLVAAAAFATTAAFSASNVFADDTTPAATKTAQTKGTINLTANDGTDANDPYKDITLVSASDISFGKQHISTAKATYNADTATGVNVVNPGVASGWTVSAKASDFTGTTGATLKGAVLTLALDNGVAADTTNESTAPFGTADQNTKENKGVAITNAAAPVLTAADSTQGVGNWTAAINKGATTLAVPAGNVADEYTATIDWTLENTPA